MNIDYDKLRRCCCKVVDIFEQEDLSKFEGIAVLEYIKINAIETGIDEHFEKKYGLKEVK